MAPPMYIERAAAAAVRHNIEMALSRTASAALATAGRHLFEGGGAVLVSRLLPRSAACPLCPHFFRQSYQQESFQLVSAMKAD